MKSKDISIIGLGKVGITLAANFATANMKVIGFDLSKKLISEILNNEYKTNEPEVEEKIYSTLNKNFLITNDIENAILNTDTSFVIVPTPSNKSGGFTNRFVINACKMIASVLPKKKTRHTIAIVSTVMPGSSDSQIIPTIEKESGLKVGIDFGYCYNPAFIALGEIVKGFSEPDFVLIGEYDLESGNTVLDLIKSILKTEPPVSRMSLIEAELTKIASNTHETMRVAFANMLMNICTEVPNTNVDIITKALSHRMGKRFFRGATPYGGPCWPRDNIALSEFMKLFNASSLLPESVHLSNNKIGEYIIKKINNICKKGSSIGILGIAYKNGTSISEESFAKKLFLDLQEKGHQVIAWDPLISKKDIEIEDIKTKLCESINECIRRSDVIIITNPLKEANLYNWKDSKDIFVIDCWRCLTWENKKNIKNYFGLGINANKKVNEWIKNELSEKYIELTQ